MKPDLLINFEATRKDLAYDRISGKWEEFISYFDTSRRIEVLINDFLGEKAIRGKKCLDAGCGLGYFSEAILKHKPASLCAFDISPNLVKKVSERVSGARCFVGDILELPGIVNRELFDVVVCSDVIEHVRNPAIAAKKLMEVIAPGGLLALSVPNRHWHWLLSLAKISGLRKNYNGYENYVLPTELKKWIKDEGFDILRSEGIHTAPFRLFPEKLLRILDQRLRNHNYGFSLNLAILTRKRE